MFRTKIWNTFVHFPTVRVRQLERKIRELEDREDREADEVINKIVERYKRKERFKKKVKDNYIAWKALLRARLIEEIGECEKCHRKDVKLTVDHILPQKFLIALGIKPEEDLNEKNFRLLCELCNSKKGHDFDFTDPRTQYLIWEYLKVLPPTPNPFKKKTDTHLKGTPYDPENIQMGKKKKKIKFKELKGTPYDPDLE